MVEIERANPAGGSGLAALAQLAAKPFADVDEAIGTTLDLIVDLFTMSMAMVQRLDGDRFIITHLIDRLGLGVSPPIPVDCSDTFCQEIVVTLEPLLIPDAAAESRFDDLLARRLIGTRTYIGVPILLSDGRLYGTLCAHDPEVRPLGPVEIDELVVLARIVASQIEREEAVTIEAETARRLAKRNAELAEAVRQLDALREIVESISSELDLEPLLRQVVASAVRLLGAHGGAISLIGESLDAPRRLTATYNLPESLRNQDIPSRAGLMGQVIAARGPVIVERYKDLDAPLPDSAFHDLAPWVAVPIWWKDEIVGTFGIGANDPTRRFGERDVELLTRLATHAAIAIENARLYAASRDLGAVEERNRLAREIHDTLAQSLLALTFQLRAARGHALSAPDRAVSELIEAEARTRAALEEARRSVWNLGPASLEAGTLTEALQGELAASERFGLPGRLVTTGLPRPLAAEAQLTLFRVAQESLANARKHARATSVEVALAYGPAEVTLTVTDDGIGFDPALATRRGTTPTGGFGLTSMAERLRGVGGRFSIDSEPGQDRGTRVLAAVPYDASRTVPAPPAATPKSEKTIRVVVADDHPAVRAGVAAILDEQPDIVVVGQAANGEEALKLVQTHCPDILMVDLRMPVLGGVETIARLAKLQVPTRAVAVTTFAQDELVMQALRAGARGYLLKDAGPDDLATAVRTVSAGGTLLTPLIAGKLAAGLASRERLTEREREVLALLAKGMPDKEIAATLGTSVKTVSFHVTNLLAKLGAQNRTEAARIAYDRGLLVD